MSILPIYEHFLRSRESQATTEVIFQAKTQAKFFSIELGPRDKLETWREHFFEEHGRAMAAKFRERGVVRFGKAFYGRANNYGSPMASSKRSGREPTFWEFARAIIDERWSGNHWDPIYAQCRGSIQ